MRESSWEEATNARFELQTFRYREAMHSSRASMEAFIFSITNRSLDRWSENKTWVWSLENKPTEFRSEGQFFQSSSRRKKKASNDCELHFIDAKLIYALK